MITPGPASIDPDTAPGGLVVHAYRIPDAALVFTQRMLDASVYDHADAVGHTTFTDAPAGVVLVYYDGDTGDRVWTQPALL